MKAIKRTVAALLATLMLATSTSFTLAAENYTEDEAVVVAKVNAAGIMTGTDKGFEPSKSLTRAEAAAIIVRMKGISESAVKAMAGTTLFNDVAAAHWASGYVNEASNLGIVKGVSAKEFAPDREVTVAEFVTMAVRALGAGTLVDSEGVWPTNYVNFANEEGLLDDVTAVYTATASRMNAATIVANTIEAKMWVKSLATTNKEITYAKSSDTILEDVLKIERYENVLVTVDKINKKVTANSLDYVYDVDPKKVVGTVYLADVDAADKVDVTTVKAGVAYDVWFDTDEKEVIGIWNAEDSKQNLTEFTEISKDNNDGTIKLKVNGSDKKYDYAAKVAVYYNGVEKDDDADLSSAKLQTVATYVNAENAFGTVRIVSNKITAIYVEEYTHVGVVDEVTSSKVKFTSLDGCGITPAKTLTINDDDYLYNMDMSNIKEGDVVFYYQEGTTKVFHVVVATETVSGKVTAHGDDYIKLDGKSFKLVGSLDIDNGKEVTAYLNQAGKIVAYEEDEDSTTNYAIIKTLEAVNGRKGVEYEVSLAHADGTVSEVYTLDLEETADEEIATNCDEEAEVLEYVAYGTVGNSTNKNKLSVAELNTAITTGTASLLGKVVDYTIKSGKLVLKEIDTDDVKGGTGKLTVSRKSDIAGYYFNSATKFLIVKSDADKKYNVKVEAVSLDGLETSTGVTYSVADIDNGYVSLVVLYNDDKAVKKVTEDGLFGVILNKEVLDEDEDYEFAYTVLFKDGAKTLYSDDDYADYTSSHINLIGTTAIEFTIANDEITDIDYATGVKTAGSEKEGFGKVSAASNAYYCISTDNDGIFEFADIEDGVTKESEVAKLTAVLADDVMFVKVDGSKFKVGDESDIVELTYNENCNDEINIDDENEIKAIYTRISSKGVEEVIAILYAK